MDAAAAASSFGVLLQIVLLDLLLSGDNALVIALACRRLPPEKARGAAWMGAAGAIGLRVFLTLMAGELMSLPFVQFLSGVVLLVISLNLMQGEDPDEDEFLASRASRSGVLAAAGVIIVSDATMSIDNVVALAAVSGGNFWLLAFGLALSIPLIIFGSFGFGRLMKVFPLLIDIGAAFLGWVAGDMITGDPLFAAWVKGEAPLVSVALPLACAVFVLAQGRMMRSRAKNSATPAKAPRKIVAPPAPTKPFAAQEPLAPDPAPEDRKELAFAEAKNSAYDELLKDVPNPEDEERMSTLTNAPSQTEHCERPAAMPDSQTVAAPKSEPVAVAARSRDEIEAEATDAASDATGDRWMLVGLVSLFVFFGLFLAYAILLPEF